MPDRLYANLAELIYDLDLAGVRLADEARWLERIRAASDWFDRWGPFIPKTETRNFDATGGKVLFVDPLLSLTTFTHDGTAITESGNLVKYPRARHWENGPYTRIELDPDASALTSFNNERDVVAIAGRWGKYEESEATGATVQNTTQISDSGTSLLVSNGAKLSPGMVLLIETEQALVTATGAATAFASAVTTSEALDATEEGIDVNSTAAMNVGEVLKVEAEDMRILTIDSATSVTVQRGYNATTRVAHTTSAAVTVYRTYTIERGVNGTTAAAHLNGVAISRYLPPWDVNWLVRQIAGLMHKKAQGGFAGKSGSAELGTIFYHDEFPKKQVADIQNRYRLTTI